MYRIDCFVDICPRTARPEKSKFPCNLVVFPKNTANAAHQVPTSHYYLHGMLAARVSRCGAVRTCRSHPLIDSESPTLMCDPGQALPHL